MHPEKAALILRSASLSPEERGAVDGLLAYQRSLQGRVHRQTQTLQELDLAVARRNDEIQSLTAEIERLRLEVLETLID